MWSDYPVYATNPFLPDKSPQCYYIGFLKKGFRFHCHDFGQPGTLLFTALAVLFLVEISELNFQSNFDMRFKKIIGPYMEVKGNYLKGNPFGWRVEP